MTRSTRFTCFCTAQTSIFQKIFVNFLAFFCECSQKFVFRLFSFAHFSNPAKKRAQSGRGCKVEPAKSKGVQSYPRKAEGGCKVTPAKLRGVQGYLRKGGVGPKLPPQGFRESGCRNGQFDAMRSRYENMHTFSVVVILQAYFIASQNLHPLSFAGVTLHPPHLCGGNFAPPSALRV